MRRTFGIWAFFGTLLLACEGTEQDGSPGAGGAIRTGRQLYSEPLDEGNSFSCSTCHALNEPAADGFRRPGHPISQAPSRPNFKNGRVSTFGEAVSSCLVEWMAAEPWAEDSDELARLEEYLSAQAPEGAAEPAPTVSFEIVAPPENLAEGDAGRGRDLFNQSCAICHGMDASGTSRALSLDGESLSAEYIAERVRLSGAVESPTYDDLTGGRMPFWSKERLTDDELRDLVAFVLGIENGDDVGVGGARNDGDGTSGVGGPPARDCPATHERVGQTASFITRFHDVGGTAEIIDDCTITVTDFTYDGEGIVVEMYGGLGSNFTNGFAVSGDLRRSAAYEGEVLTLTLPEGKTLDDLDSLSVWCVDVDVSFGDATFQ